jgi:hypothetical protein
MSKYTNEGISLDDSVLLTNLAKEEVQFIQDNERQIRALVTNLLAHDACSATLDYMHGDLRSFTIEYKRSF